MPSRGRKRPNPMSLSAGPPRPVHTEGGGQYRVNTPTQHWTGGGYHAEDTVETTPGGNGGYQMHSRGSQQPNPMFMSTGILKPIHIEGAGRYRVQLAYGSFESGTPITSQNFSYSQKQNSIRKRTRGEIGGYQQLSYPCPTSNMMARSAPRPIHIGGRVYSQVQQSRRAGGYHAEGRVETTPTSEFLPSDSGDKTHGSTEDTPPTARVNRLAPGWVPPPPTDAEAPDMFARMRPYLPTLPAYKSTITTDGKTNQEKGSPTTSQEPSTDDGTASG